MPVRQHILDGFADGFLDRAERAGVSPDVVDDLLKLACALDSAHDAESFHDGFASGPDGLFPRSGT